MTIFYLRFCTDEIIRWAIEVAFEYPMLLSGTLLVLLTDYHTTKIQIRVLKCI